MDIFEVPLLNGLTKNDLEEMSSLHLLRRQTFEKHAVILHSGDPAREIGIVLSGSVLIESVDVWGTKSILGHAEEGHIFAESYALCRETLQVDAVAAEPSSILFLNAHRLLSQENAGRTWHAGLMGRLIALTARKNLSLSARIFCTSPSSARRRVLTYLSGQAKQHGQTDFDIPFNRQQMADYLNLDRSALSKELGRMRREGLIDFRKNHFRLAGEDVL